MLGLRQAETGTEMSFRKLIRVILAVVVFVTFLANILFILETTRQMNLYHETSKEVHTEDLLGAKSEKLRELIDSEEEPTANSGLWLV